MKSIYFLPFCIVMLFVTDRVNAQTFEEFKKQRQEEFRQYKENETRKMQELREKYDQYVREREMEFADYLKQRWESFEVYKGMPAPEGPKPVVIPEYIPPGPETVPEPAPDPVIERAREEGFRMPARIMPVPAPEEKPLARLIPLQVKIEPDQYLKADLKFTFYGSLILLDYDKALATPAPAPVNEDGISLYWKKACEANYNQLVNQLLQYKSALGLNDWGYYLLIRETASRIAPDGPNDCNLLTWFLLTRSGYKAKISYYEEQTSVIVPAEQVMYGKKYFNIGPTTYYFLDTVHSNVIHTYARDYHDATRLINFDIDRSLNLGEKIVTRNFSFRYDEKPFQVKVNLNENIIHFYRDYPQVNIDVYFNAAVEKNVVESLALALLPYLEPLTEVEKVNFLLRFVQTAFQYKVDQEQFGREKYFFAEEVLHYPYSDCEDRSVLFTFLVSELLRMKVIGLGFPGHVATAVSFSADAGIRGPNYLYRNDRYIITDPTYINAPAGLTMPQFASAEAEIIPLKRINYAGGPEIDFWELAAKAGGYRGGNQKDLITDETGSVFLTGYFNNSFQASNIRLEGDPERRTAFIAKYDRYGELQWASAPRGQAVSAGFALAGDDQQNVMIAGSFQGQVHFGGYTLMSYQEKPDVFVAKYDPRGNPVWAGQARLDTIDQESYLKYIAKFTRTGKHLGTDLYLDDVEYSESGFYADDQGNTYLAGNLNSTTGFMVRERVFHEAGAIDYSLMIKNESDRLIMLDFERNIAAIFAITSLIRSNGMVIPGQAVQQALDKYQPGFNHKYPELYTMIGNITLLKNKDGIITLLTKNNETINYDKLRIASGTQLKITLLQNGNERIDILSGIRVGKFLLWFPLNYIQMDHLSGNMLFDYDRSHMQMTLNLKEDIINK